MTKSVTQRMSEIGGSVTPSSAPAAIVQEPEPDAALVILPAGFFADIVGGLSGTIGELTGDLFGEAKLGRTIGDAASPLIKLLPFQVIPPEIPTESEGQESFTTSGQTESMVIVPAAFIGGILGGLGGKLLGGQVDKWLGGSGDAGAAIGSTIAGALGSLLPFQVLPPELTPASVGPDQGSTDGPMVVVPASFFGNLLDGVTMTLTGLISNKAAREVAEKAAPLLRDLLPFQSVPPELAPAGAGPSGATTEDERLIMVPASFFSSIVRGLAGTIGGEVGSWFNERKIGAQLGGAAGRLLEGVLPFHELPPALAPASAGPGAVSDEKLMLVPAGLFSGLLSSLAGAAGGAVGDLFGNREAGKAAGDAAAPFIKMLPFQVVAPDHA